MNYTVVVHTYNASHTKTELDINITILHDPMKFITECAHLFMYLNSPVRTSPLKNNHNFTMITIVNISYNITNVVFIFV